MDKHEHIAKRDIARLEETLRSTLAQLEILYVGRHVILQHGHGKANGRKAIIDGVFCDGTYVYFSCHAYRIDAPTVLLESDWGRVITTYDKLDFGGAL